MKPFYYHHVTRAERYGAVIVVPALADKIKYRQMCFPSGHKAADTFMQVFEIDAGNRFEIARTVRGKRDIRRIFIKVVDGNGMAFSPSGAYIAGKLFCRCRFTRA